MKSSRPTGPSPAGLTRGAIFFTGRWIAGGISPFMRVIAALCPAMTRDGWRRHAPSLPERQRS
jgi:hypothetical protein